MGKMRTEVIFNPSSSSTMYLPGFGKLTFSKNLKVFLFAQESQDRAGPYVPGGLSHILQRVQDLWVSVTPLILFM